MLKPQTTVAGRPQNHNRQLPMGKPPLLPAALHPSHGLKRPAGSPGAAAGGRTAAGSDTRVFLAFLAAFALVLQLAFGGLMQGAMAAPAPAADFILCVAGDHAAAQQPAGSNGKDHPPLPPCCFAGCLMVTPLAPPPATAWTAPVPAPELISERPLPAQAGVPPAAPPSAHRARAPPARLIA